MFRATEIDDLITQIEHPALLGRKFPPIRPSLRNPTGIGSSIVFERDLLTDIHKFRSQMNDMSKRIQYVYANTICYKKKKERERKINRKEILERHKIERWYTS